MPDYDLPAEAIEDARSRRRKLVDGLEPPPETSDDRILQRGTCIPLDITPGLLL